MVPWSKPTIEASTHLAIYRARPEVGAIVHTHGEWVSVFAMLGMDIPLVLAGQGEQGIIRCAGYGRAGSPELNKYVVEALGTTAKAALMRNHGAIAVADTLDHAFEVAAWLETVAEKAYYSILLASKRPVDVAARYAGHRKVRNPAMNHTYLLGVDLGTTAIKAALVTTEGEVVCSDTQEYTSITPL